MSESGQVWKPWSGPVAQQESSSKQRTDRSIKSLLHLTIGRRPHDAVRLLLAAGLLAGTTLLALIPVGQLELAVYRQVRAIPSITDPAWSVLIWFGSWAGIAGLAALAFYFKRMRVGVLCAVGGSLAWAASSALHLLLGPRETPFATATVSPGFLFPAASVAIMAALAVICTPYLGRVVRHIGWILTVLVAVADVHLGYHLPLGALGGALLGWGVGALLHLLWGAPGRKVSEEVVLHELELAGLRPVHITGLRYRLTDPREFQVLTADQQTLRVKVIRRIGRRAGFWHKLGRMLTVLEAQPAPQLSSRLHEAEHEAYMTLLASRAGVRTPPIVLACDFNYLPPLLVVREIPGRRLTELEPEEIDDALLDEIWRQIAALAGARIAHHDLRAKNVLVDDEKQPWLLSFTFAQAGANPGRLALDLAEALLSVSAVAGVDRTVTSAMRVLSGQELSAALVNLVPLALPRRILAQADVGRQLLTELRETLADRTDQPIPGFRSPVRPASAIGLVLIGAAVYLLLPELSSMQEVVDELRTADWGWLAVATATGFLGVLMSAISILGSSRTALPFWKTLAVQVAAAFTGRTTPAGAGFFGINLVFLERLGLRRSLAVGVTLLNQAATGAVAFLMCVVGVFGLGLSGTFANLSTPTGWQVLLPVVGGLIAVGVLLWSPFGRRRIVQPGLEVASELLQVFRHPVRAAQLCGGALGYLVVSGYGLAACLSALQAEFSLIAVVVVFTAGNTIGHLAPSPGGIGAVEASLVAGLTAIGISPTSSITAVLISRLLTYWLPVLPGIAMFRYLQHRQVI